MQELVELERAIRETTRRRKRDLAEEEMRLQRRIVGKIRDKIVEYAEDEKLDLVVDSAAISAGGVPMVIYNRDAIDITERIIELTGGEENPQVETDGELLDTDDS